MKRCSPIIDNSTAIAVLAAGSGARFGGGKLDAELNGRPVGRWVTDTAEQAGFAKRIIVTSPVPPAFVSKLCDWQIVINGASAEGVASSIRAAVYAAGDCDRIVIALADMPLIGEQHLTDLALATGITFTAYPDGSRGVPAAFPESCYAGLSELSGTMGAAASEWGEEIISIAPNLAESLLDVDTSQDIRVIRRLATSIHVRQS